MRLAGLLGCLMGLTTLLSTSADVATEAGGEKVRLGRPVPPDLGGADRYLPHVSTDKPVYRGGEKVYIRGVVLHAVRHTPNAADAQSLALIEIIGPKGDKVASGYSQARDSVVGFAWDVPEQQPGGEYVAKISFPSDGYAPAERKFDVRAYRAPRLKSQIVFVRDGYGPGDRVAAGLHVERAEGGFPEGAPVTAIARVDGEEVFRGATRVDSSGNSSVQFALPEKIARGEGTLALVIEDGGVSETATKTIPILLQTVDLVFYPESGDLVADLATRVYVEARTPADKPADIAGVVVDADGRAVATLRTEHEGRGRFEFTPRRGGTYTLKITEPAGIAATFPLPAVKETGAVLRACEERAAKDAPVKLRAASTSAGKLTVTLRQREVDVAALTFDAKAGQPVDIELTPPAQADGVLIATLWDAAGTPLAERLIYRQPARSLRIAINADKPSYIPGDSATLTIKTTDDTGQPVSAIAGLTVTDDSVLEMIEKREQAPRLPVMVLLEADVRELADAHMYLDESNPKAPAALDLILGTQGWRRFALVDAQKFLAAHGDAARRVLAQRTPVEQRRRLFFGGAVDGAGPLGEERLGLREGLVQLARAGADFNDNEVPNVPAASRPQPALPAAGPAADKKDRDRKLEVAKSVGAKGRSREAEVRAQRQAGADFLEAAQVAVREYAHALRPNRQPNERTDFTETLFWHAGIRTDAQTGEAKVTFAMSDAVTAFRVLADGFAADGRLGAGATKIESREPFYIEPKLPLEVTSGDVVRVPVAIINGTSGELGEAKVVADLSGPLSASPLEPFKLSAQSRQRSLLDLAIGSASGVFDFTLRGSAGAFADSVTRKLTVKPLGFPVEVAAGGTIEAGGTVVKKLVIPSDVVPGSLASSIAIYPTPLANLTEALSRLLQEPNGCFEQTSSTTYPLVMAQQYFLSHTDVEPALIERSRGLLEKGYAKLVGFECKQKGYEWFAADPGHEALTAFGLLEFSDMAKTRTVDAGMLERTRRWLLDRRDGQGGFSRERRALHTWVAKPEYANAYIAWAMLEAGEKDLSTEVAWLKKAVAETSDSYVVALVANVMALAGETETSRKLMERLTNKQTKEGRVDGATTSIVGSGGEALQIETTALAVLAWLRDPAFTTAVESAIRYLAESCKAGRYGSTQSTVLALRAIVAYDQSRARPKAPGSAVVLVDGRPVGESVRFDEQTQSAIKLPDISAALTRGEHTVELKLDGGSTMPFALAVNFYRTKPDSSSEGKVGLNVALRDGQVAEGEITEANVEVVNRGDETLPTPIAIIGLPGGLEPRHDQLKELVKAGKIDAYEVLGREVVLYWRALAPQQKVDLPLSLIAAIPGTYTGPASRAYLYYTDEHKQWADGLKVTIAPRG